MKETPEYIMDFIREIAPEAPELYMSCFDEQQCLTDATTIMRDLRTRMAALEETAIDAIEIGRKQAAECCVRNWCWRQSEEDKITQLTPHSKAFGPNALSGAYDHTSRRDCA